MGDWASMMDVVREAQERVAEEEPIASAIREAEDKLQELEDAAAAMRDFLARLYQSWAEAKPVRDYQATIQTIFELSEDSRGEEAVSPSAALRALRVFREFHNERIGAPEVDAHHLEGGISLRWKRKTYSLDIFVDPYGSAVWGYTHGGALAADDYDPTLLLMFGEGWQESPLYDGWNLFEGDLDAQGLVIVKRIFQHAP